MTDPALQSHGRWSQSDPLWPEPAVVRQIELETPGTATFWLELQDRQRRASFRFAPGQFNMLYVPGVGEVPISISGSSDDGVTIAHTIRFVGQVTRVIEQLRPGSVLGLRGPYGIGWPVARARGKDAVIVGGGLGLAPLRPAIHALLADRAAYGRVILLYGARSPAELLYAREYAGWQQRGLETLITVDHADATWRGIVGVVPALLARLASDLKNAVVFTCGPEIMMRFAIYEALGLHVPEDQIYLSIELNMQCAVGLCGRCQLGPYFVCKDGPVFAHRVIAHFFRQEHF